MRLDKQGINAYKKTMNDAGGKKARSSTSLATKRISAPVLSPKTSNISSPTTDGASVRLTALLAQKEGLVPSMPSQNRKSGSRKAAELLLLMGKDQASKVLQHMKIDEVSAVIRELAEIKELNRQEAEKTLNEFGRRPNEQSEYKGGIDIARGFLRVAFGNDEGERILQNAASPLFTNPFGFLEELPVDQLLSLLKNESLETLAVIVPRLRPVTAREILKGVPFFEQTDLLKRIAQNRKVDGSVIAKMEEVLRKRINEQGLKVEKIELDGKKALADILRYMSSNEEQKIMSHLAITLPDELKAIEDNLFGIESLLLVQDRDLQTILQSMNDNELAVLIKGKEPSIRKKLLKNLSQHRRTLVLEEEQMIGPIRLTDVDKATREFLDALRIKEKQGQIVLLREGEFI